MPPSFLEAFHCSAQTICKMRGSVANGVHEQINKICTLASWPPDLLPLPAKPLRWVWVLIRVEKLYPDPNPSTTQHETQWVYPTCYNAYAGLGSLIYSDLQSLLACSAANKAALCKPVKKSQNRTFVSWSKSVSMLVSLEVGREREQRRGLLEPRPPPGTVFPMVENRGKEGCSPQVQMPPIKPL